MHTALRALLRPLVRPAQVLAALLFLPVTAPLSAAAGTGPVISASISPATLPVTGGVITVTATVTDADSSLKSVQATILANSAGFSPSGGGGDTINLYSSGGNVYTGTITSAANDTSAVPYIYTATITAADQTVSNTINVTGQTVQANDNAPPAITSTSVSPTTLPAIGGVLTVSAVVTDIRPIKSVQATVLANSAGFSPSGGGGDTINLYSSGGDVYTGTITSASNNTSSVFYTYTATVTATNDLNLSDTINAVGQAVQLNTSGTTPQVGTTHILWANTDGRLSLWNYDPIGGGFTQKTYGPYAGWSAKAIADGGDGKTRVLWDNTDGQMSLWNLDNTTGLFTQNAFGPYPGWTAIDASVGL